MTSPAIENPACIVQMCHFTHCCHSCKSDSGVAGGSPYPIGPLSVCPVLSCPIRDVGVLWPNGWVDQHATWHRARPRPRPHCVTQLPPKGHSPQFSAHVCCGQTAGWIKIPLDTEVGLDPGYVVLDGDTQPSREMGTAAPTFRPTSIVAKRSPISSTAELLYKLVLQITIRQCH